MQTFNVTISNRVNRDLANLRTPTFIAQNQTPLQSYTTSQSEHSSDSFSSNRGFCQVKGRVCQRNCEGGSGGRSIVE